MADGLSEMQTHIESSLGREDSLAIRKLSAVRLALRHSPSATRICDSPYAISHPPFGHLRRGFSAGKLPPWKLEHELARARNKRHKLRPRRVQAPVKSFCSMATPSLSAPSSRCRILS